MEQWKEYQLGDLLNFRRGHDLPKSEMIAGDIPVAGSNGVIGFHNEATPISPCITIGRSGNVGTPNFYEKCWAHNTVLYIDDFKENNPEFLFYLLKTIPLKSFGGGSAVPTLNRNHIHPIVIKSTKDIKLQQKIVEILKSLDDKIELNRQINDNLEQQAQALFKSWFVDFEPFKDGEFVDSEFGMIPKGWRVGSLNEFCSNIERGNIPKYVDKSNSPILNQKVNKGLYLDTQYYKFNDDNAIVPDSKLAQKGDVLVNSLGQGTLGRIHLYKETKNNVIVDQFITILRTTSFVKSIYLYLLLNTDIYQNVIESNITGSTGMWVLTINNIRKIKIVQPHDCEFEKIESYFSSIYNSISANNAEIERLSTLRDTLLPRLMSGELKINEINC